MTSQAFSWKVPPSLTALWKPLTMLFKRFGRCFRFLFLNLVFGLLGVYVLLLVPVFVADHSFVQEWESSLRSGALYTFTIALLSSTALLLLESQPRQPDKHIARLKPTLVLIALALVTFSAIGAAMQVWLDSSKASPAGSAFRFQSWLFYAGVIVSLYCFLVAIYEEELDDYLNSDNARRDQLAEEASSAQSDGRGMAV